MRVALITATFPPYYGGTGNVCYHNALELAKRGHDVHVFTRDYPEDGYLYPPEFNVHHLHTFFQVGNAALLPGLLQINNYDILHLHYPFLLSAELITLISKIRHMPLVITYHQDILLHGIQNFLVQIYDHTFGTWILRLADQILFTTLDYGKHSKAKWLFDERRDQIFSLPNATDIHNFHPGLPQNTIREKHQIESAKTVLLLVGRLDKAHYFKGVDVLLRAIHLINAKSLHLIVVGDGDLRKHYQKMAKDFCLDDQITFAGRVTEEELPLYYAASDIGLLPSTTMGEAFGLVLLEAMACGKPVIASNLPGVRQLVKDKFNGTLCEPGNSQDLAEKIQYLAQHSEFRRKLGSNGRIFIENNYSWEKIGNQLEKIYFDVLKRDT